MTGRAILRGLVPGQSYTLHQVTSLGEVPSSPAGAVGGRVIQSFVAAAAEQSFDVSWQSGTISYFIARGAVAAPGGGGTPSTPVVPPSTPTNPPPATPSTPVLPPPTTPTAPPVTPPPTTGAGNGITAGSAAISGCPDIQATLDAHNAARARRGAAPLVWSDELAKFAMTVSSTCVMKHSNGPYGERERDLRASSPPAMLLGAGHSGSMRLRAPADGRPSSRHRAAAGENLAWGSALRTCKVAVDMWMEEEAAWRPGGGFSAGTGHFTQVVWKSTKRVGCALKCNLVTCS